MHNQKIFISIASWRDPFVVQTVRSAYANARYPERLTFGIFFQRYPGEDWMLDGLFNIGANIKLRTIDANSAPAYITDLRKSIYEELMEDEQFFMQIDSHNKFAKNWDINIIAELSIANKKFGKSIINPQVLYFDKWSEPINEMPFTAICNQDSFRFINHFAVGNGPVALGGQVIAKPNNTMINEKFFNANSIFANKDFLLDVGYPKQYAMNYEQQIMALRCFTAGYNMVSPINAYTSCFNYYSESSYKDYYIRHRRSEDPIWSKQIQQIEMTCRDLYHKVILEKIIDKDIGMYKEKTYDEYVDFVGYDPYTLVVTRKPKMFENNNFIFVSDEELENERKRLFNE